MLAENQGLNDANNIFLVFRVAELQFFENARLDQSLLIKSLLVSENFQGHGLALLVVIALEHLAERTFSDALLHFEPIANVVVNIADVLSFVIVKTPVLRSVWRGNSSAIFSFENVEVVDSVVLKNLALFIVEKVLGEVHHDFTRLHRELDLELPLLVVCQQTLPCDCREGLDSLGRVG